MRRNRKNSIKKERTIMIASSAFVLAALTMTGIYMKNGGSQVGDNGYTLDFTQLDEDEQDKLSGLAQNTQAKDTKVQNQQADNAAIQPQVTENDLDYMPLEEPLAAGSGLVEIPGLTDKEAFLSEEDTAALAEENEQEQPVSAQNAVVGQMLEFKEENGLLRPVQGDVLLPYSMDTGIYFYTLKHYKCNPAVVFSAEQGSSVVACADAQVKEIFENEEIGRAVTLDLGDGYQATYGQLEKIYFSVGEYVTEGAVIGIVAEPTCYYSVEGSNLYFSLEKDGEKINPEELFR